MRKYGYFNFTVSQIWISGFLKYPSEATVSYISVVDAELLCEFVGDADGVAVMASQWRTSQFDGCVMR